MDVNLLHEGNGYRCADCGAPLTRITPSAKRRHWFSNRHQLSLGAKGRADGPNREVREDDVEMVDDIHPKRGPTDFESSSPSEDEEIEPAEEFQTLRQDVDMQQHPHPFKREFSPCPHPPSPRPITQSVEPSPEPFVPDEPPDANEGTFHKGPGGLNHHRSGAAKDPRTPFKSGLDFLLTLFRTSTCDPPSRSLFEFVLFLVCYGQTHPQDIISSMDELWNRIDQKIPAGISMETFATSIETEKGPKTMHSISLASTAQLALGDPELAPHIGFLPQLNTQGGLSNICEADRWHTDPAFQVANIRRSDDGKLVWQRSFYRLENGIVWTRQFLERDIGGMLARVRSLRTFDAGASWFVDMTTEHYLLVEQLGPRCYGVVDTRSLEMGGTFFLAGVWDRMCALSEPKALPLSGPLLTEWFIEPHPLSARIGERRHVNLPWWNYSDGFSGVSGTKYDPWENFAANLAGIPFHINNHLGHQFLISVTRPPIKVLQMAKVVLETGAKQLRQGFCAYHSAFKEEVFVTGNLCGVKGDNPRIKEFVSTYKTVVKQSCHHCHILAPLGFQLGLLRTAEEARKVIFESRIVRARPPPPRAQSDRLLLPAQVGGPAKADELLLSYGIKDVGLDGYISNNPYLHIPNFDIYTSNVGDLLHWDEGVPKYLAQDMKWFLRGDRSIAELAAIVDSLNHDGLPLKLTGIQVSKYTGSMNAGHFKVMSQVIFFALMHFVYGIRHVRRSTKTPTTAPKLTRGKRTKASGTSKDSHLGDVDDDNVWSIPGSLDDLEAERDAGAGSRGRALSTGSSLGSQDSVTTEAPTVAQRPLCDFKIPVTYLEVWVLTSAMMVLMHQSDIRNVAAYYAKFKSTRDRWIEAVKRYCSKRFALVKMHQPLHVEEWVRIFGPLLHLSAEKLEQLHGRLRACIQRTNNLQPERDVITRFKRVTPLVYMTHGGTWDVDGDRISLSPDLQSLGKKPIISQMFGLADMEELKNHYSSSGKAGELFNPIGRLDSYLQAINKSPQIVLAELLCHPLSQSLGVTDQLHKVATSMSLADYVRLSADATTYAGVYAADGTILKNGSNFVTESNKLYRVGSIAQIFFASRSFNVILANPYSFVGKVFWEHPRLILQTHELHLLYASEVVQHMSIQHDCIRNGTCQFVGNSRSGSLKFVHDTAANYYLLNVFKFGQFVV